MKENSTFRREARGVLSGQWGLAALCMFITCVLSVLVSFVSMVGWALSILLLPLNYGLALLFLRLYRGTSIEIPTLLEGFNDYGRIFCTLFLQGLYTVLWSLLLIVPGIIKAYSYAMTPYILADYPELKNNAAIEKSMRMMDGHKMKLFLLDLSFIGWILLSFLTLGIGFLFLSPYMTTAHVAFYEDLKAEQPMLKA
ncbi:MAG: DUF975 family protein [Bacteroidaceae bacterium]